MTYYATLAEDLARAKEILEKGREQVDPQAPAAAQISAGHIYAADIYSAYKLLESFVEAIEHLNDLPPKLQFMVDWADENGLLSDHVFTFPDGDSWEAKPKDTP